jgi:fatty-acyl-CoA synthase
VSRASHVVGETHSALLTETIGRQLARTVARFPDRPALISRHQHIRWSWSELDARVKALAAGLWQQGLRAGDRLGIWSPNRAEWVVVQLASAHLGAILVTINPAYRLAELEHALKLSGCRALILAPRFKTSDYLDMIRALAPELATCAPGQLRCERLPDLRLVISLSEPATGMMAYDALLLANPADAPTGEGLVSSDPINIQFTSGTTGLPKGATLTHRNILNNGAQVGRGMAFTESDVLCIPVPLYHCFGMVMGVLNCLVHGAAMVLPSDAFDPKAVLAAIEAERCTALFGVPTMFIAELNDPDFSRFDLSSLRTGIMAGAPCPVEVMRRVSSDMNMRDITIAYGMTETSPVSFQTPLDASLEKRVGTVGKILPHIEAKIIDDTGATVFAGQKGELVIRGYSVMRGYWSDPQRTARAIDIDGWMHTGDLATLDTDGFCNIVGRLKDMIIRGGENIYPAEIEQFLYRHQAIADVAVFGVPHDRWGEEVCAWIRLVKGAHLSAKDIQEFCADQIAHYKIPTIIRFVDSLPMTVTGKVQKYVMREAMRSELGLAEQNTA